MPLESKRVTTNRTNEKMDQILKAGFRNESLGASFLFFFFFFFFFANMSVFYMIFTFFLAAVRVRVQIDNFVDFDTIVV